MPPVYFHTNSNGHREPNNIVGSGKFSAIFSHNIPTYLPRINKNSVCRVHMIVAPKVKPPVFTDFDANSISHKLDKKEIVFT